MAGCPAAIDHPLGAKPPAGWFSALSPAPRRPPVLEGDRRNRKISLKTDAGFFNRPGRYHEGAKLRLIVDHALAEEQFSLSPSGLDFSFGFSRIRIQFRPRIHVSIENQAGSIAASGYRG